MVIKFFVFLIFVFLIFVTKLFLSFFYKDVLGGLARL